MRLAAGGRRTRDDDAHGAVLGALIREREPQRPFTKRVAARLWRRPGARRSERGCRCGRHGGGLGIEGRSGGIGTE